MNTVVLLGRITAPLELKQTQSGKSVVSFSLAVKRPYEKDVTDFYNVTAWNKQAELLSMYVDKGNRLCVRGHLQNSSWEKDGQKHYKTEIIADEVFFVDSKNDAQGAETAQGGSFIPPAYQMPVQPKFEEIKADDDLPF